MKREEVYWHVYRSPADGREKLATFRARYSEIRPHWALVPIEGGDPLAPAEVYVHGLEVQVPPTVSPGNGRPGGGSTSRARATLSIGVSHEPKHSHRKGASESNGTAWQEILPML